MSELKFLPCMCCGGNRIIHFKTSKNRGYATCIDCGMRTRGCGNYENKDDLKWKDRATILWNTRKPMANIVEKLEEIKGKACDGIECVNCVYNKDCYEGEMSEVVAIDKAINIVKQEINNGLE